MACTGFLHAASTKAIVNNLRQGGDQAHYFSGDGQQSNADSQGAFGALRLLLVEEEIDGTKNNGCEGIGIGSLARSLAMDAAYSTVASSPVPCRGCSEDGGTGTNDNDSQSGAEILPMPCRCCKIALLVPGEPKRPKNKRRRKSNGSKFLGDTAKAAFPMHCVFDGMEDTEQWDQSVLGQIQVKYVNSLGDVIRYLAYAPSLPENFQPLDGIFVLGLGELLSREDRNTTSVMEFTHILSLLSDTANVLGEKRQEVLKLNTSPRFVNHKNTSIAVIASIDKCTYSSIPPKVTKYLHQWVDFTASIEPAKSIVGVDAATAHSEWELAFENMGILQLSPKAGEEAIEHEKSSSFFFKSDSHKIVWKV